MPRSNTNSRHMMSARLSAFKFFVVVMYVACFVNLSTKTKIASLVLFVYGSLAGGRSVMKSIVTVSNGSTLSGRIDASSP